MARRQSPDQREDEKRRGRGDRKVFFDEDRQKYVGQLSYVDEKTGKRNRPKVYGDTEPECRRLMKELEREIEKGLRPDKGSKYTVKSWLDVWFETFQKPNVRANTWERQALCIKQINAEIGNIRLSKLRAEDVQGLYNKLGKEGKKKKDPETGKVTLIPLSSQSVVHCHNVLHKALKQAVKLKYISANVTEDADKPIIKRKEINPMTEEQAQAFLKAVKSHRLYASFFLDLSTGLRLGELLALAWDDVDLDKGKIFVRRALQNRQNGGVVFEDLKSKKSRRTLSLPPDAVVELKKHKSRQAEEHMAARVRAAKHAKKFGVEIDPESYWVESGLVFRQLNGDRLDPHSYYRTYKKLLKEEAKMDGFRFHDLRHTFATLMFKKGVDVKIVSEMLGHASIQITYDTYVHVMPGMTEQAAMVLQGVFTG